MKKQIFILALFVLAVFTSLTRSYGQTATHGNTAPTPITCSTTDPLNPIPGIPYNYSAGLNPAGGSAVWHVSYNPSAFITNNSWAATDEAVGGSFISAASGMTNATATSPSTASITWKTEGSATVDATHPLFVSLVYTAPSATGCANNLQVFRVTPKNAFTVDITNMNNTGSTSSAIGASYAQCFSDIAGAVFTTGTPGTVTMNYGDNTMYFEVIAANFTTSFTPTFKISGLQGNQTADVTWGYTVASATTVIATATTNATLNPITALTSATNTSNGVSIYVKVVVHNRAYEGLSDTPITLAVEATNTAGQHDVLPDCTVPLAASQFEDAATQTLKLRPTITTTITGGFLNKN